MKHASSSDSDQFKKPSRMKLGSKKATSKVVQQRQRLRKAAAAQPCNEPDLDSTVESLGAEVKALIGQTLALRIKYNQLLVQGKVLQQTQSMPLPSLPALLPRRSAATAGGALTKDVPDTAAILSPSSSATEDKRSDNKLQTSPSFLLDPPAAHAAAAPPPPAAAQGPLHAPTSASRQNSPTLAKSSSQQLMDLPPEQLDFSDLIYEALAGGPQGGLCRSASASMDHPRHPYAAHPPPTNPEGIHGPFACHQFNRKMQTTLFSDLQAPALGIPVHPPSHMPAKLPPHAFPHPFPPAGLHRHRPHTLCPPGQSLDRARSTPLPLPDFDLLPHSATLPQVKESPSSQELALLAAHPRVPSLHHSPVGRSKSMLLHPPALGTPALHMQYSGGGGGPHRARAGPPLGMRPAPRGSPDHSEILQDEDEDTMDYLAQVVLGPAHHHAMQPGSSQHQHQRHPHQQHHSFDSGAPLASPRQAATPPGTARSRMQQQQQQQQQVHYLPAYPGAAEDYLGMQMDEPPGRWEAEAYGKRTAPPPPQQQYMYVDVSFIDPDDMAQDDGPEWREM